MAAMRACAPLIQASAGARALGGSSPSSATAPARSPREAFASLRATIAAPSLPGASSTRRMRTSFSALSCSRPSTPSRGGGSEACSSAGASAENCRARVAAVGTPARANGSSAAASFGSAPSALTVSSSAAKASPRSTAALSAVAASASRTVRSARAAAFSLCSTAATRLASASNSLRSIAAGGFCASSASSAALASARTRASRAAASASSSRRPRTPTASASAFSSVWSAATRAANAGSPAPGGGAAPVASSLATRPATSSRAFGSAAGGGAREARSRRSSSTPARRAPSALTPLSRLRMRLTSPSTARTRPMATTATPSKETPRRGASGGGLPGTSGGSGLLAASEGGGLEGSSLEGVAGGASMRALLSPYRAARLPCPAFGPLLRHLRRCSPSRHRQVGLLRTIRGMFVRASRRPDELNHGRLGGARREADGGGAGGGERLRHLAGETKVHERERALVRAGARGAIEIGLRAPAGKMQDAVERTLRQRHRNVRRKALDLDRAIGDRRQQRHAARGEIAGAVLAREIEERRGLFGEARAQQRGEIVRVAVGALDRAEARGARGLGGVAADREGGKRGERVAPGMAGDGARGVPARHHHRAQRLAREFDIDGIDA